MKHTSQQFEDDLRRLKESLLLMGGLIESMLKETKSALVNNDPELAGRLIDRDYEIDQLEKKVDEQAIQILALRQPAAQDLRFVTASMKICTDLERMGDIIVNVCERIQELSNFPQIKSYKDLPEMMDVTGRFITNVIDAFVNLSPEMATEAMKAEDIVDDYFRRIWEELVALVKQRPEIFEPAIKLMFITKYLERLADHATNIAEQVVFTVKGLDIRHTGDPSPTP